MGNLDLIQLTEQTKKLTAMVVEDEKVTNELLSSTFKNFFAKVESCFDGDTALKVYEQMKPDVVFVHSMESFTSLYLLSKKKLYKDFLLTCDTHTLYNQFTNSIFEKIYFFLYKKLVFPKINKYKIPVFYTANENKKILINQYRILDKLIYPYPIGSDSSVFFKNKEAGHNLRTKLKIAQNTKIILYTGKFNYPKSPHILLEAVQKIKNDLNDFKIVMIGAKNNEYFNTFFDNPNYENLPLLILAPVKVTELNAYYNMADIAVFPKENTLSALDCQLCGLPVIMEENITNMERLKKGGLCYKPNNIDDLSKKIYLLLSDKHLHEKLSNEGLQFIEANYSYKKIIKKTEDVFRHFLFPYNRRQCS
ncbi:MAG: glycosyltransferase [Bacteroidales bacterium]|nr:glycosyltransferase [Bacteroidales bacterium]